MNKLSSKYQLLGAKSDSKSPKSHLWLPASCAAVLRTRMKALTIGLLALALLPQAALAQSSAHTLTTSDVTMSGGTIIKYTGSAKNIVIPATIEKVSVTSIGARAFVGEKLTSVTIPSSVTSIGAAAFRSNQLATVTIPNSVTSIGADAFYENKLTSVTIPSGVTGIVSGVFGSNQLTSVTIPSSVTSIGQGAFSVNQLTSVIIPSSVTSIGPGAFSVNQLTSVTLTAKSHLKSIGQNAFNGNQHLAPITWPTSAYLNAGSWKDSDGRVVNTMNNFSLAYALHATGGTDLSLAPSDMALSPKTIAENQPAGTRIGTLSTTDADVGDTHTYSLSGKDASSFKIEGNELKSNVVFDFETQSSYTITVTTTDKAGLTHAKTFTVKILPPPLSLTSVEENTLQVSPVPTSGRLHLRLDAATGSLALRLSTSTGVVVRSRTTTKASEFWQHTLDLSDLPQGVYMLEVLGESQRWTRKVVKE